MGISSENKYDYKNVFSVVYMIGKPLDTERKEFQFSEMYELDKGFDFYAPQSYEDENIEEFYLDGLEILRANIQLIRIIGLTC